MRDDLFCFTFMGHRVCVQLDKSPAGWSYTVDGLDEAAAPHQLSWSERMVLEEAGMAARSHIRAMGALPSTPSQPLR